MSEASRESSPLLPGAAAVAEDAPLQRRLVLLLAGVAALSLLVVVRLWVLMVLQGGAWRTRGESNFLQARDIVPPRGAIRDSAGRPLAVNLPVFDLGLVRYRQREGDLVEALRELRRLLPDETLPAIGDVMASVPSWKEILLVQGLDPDTAAPILEQLGRWEFLRATRRYERFYPLERAAAPLLGYLRLIPEEKQEEYLAGGYRLDDLVGWTGIERAWEEWLRGDAGSERRRRDALNRELGVDLAQSATPGATLYLTLDARIQKAGYDAFGGHSGAAVALDPRTGGILAAITTPSFDPATRRLGPDDSEFNRAFGTATAPGSTFKIFTAVALLENDLPAGRTFCNGAFYLPNWKRAFHCGHRQGHGFLDLREMLKSSCNVYIYRGAHQLGDERFAEVCDRFGFGRPTGLSIEGIAGEATGTTHQPGVGGAGELIIAGIGQGRLSVTPVQLAAATAAIANGGVWYRPHLADRVESLEGEVLWRQRPQGHAVRLAAPHRARIVEGMRAVCQEPGGTAWHTGFEPAWDVAGKTGTAQRGRIPDSVFVCFAPARDPRIVIAVRAEVAGAGGDLAATIAREMLRAWFAPPEEEAVRDDAPPDVVVHDPEMHAAAGVSTPR